MTMGFTGSGGPREGIVRWVNFLCSDVQHNGRLSKARNPKRRDIGGRVAIVDIVNYYCCYQWMYRLSIPCHINYCRGI